MLNPKSSNQMGKLKQRDETRQRENLERHTHSTERMENAVNCIRIDIRRNNIFIYIFFSLLFLNIFHISLYNILYVYSFRLMMMFLIRCMCVCACFTQKITQIFFIAVPFADYWSWFSVYVVPIIFVYFLLLLMRNR